MIIYEKRFGAFNLLLRFYGAPWPRAALLSLPSTLLGALVAGLARDYSRELFLHPAAYLAFGSIFAFFLIFRTNLSYTRYWEGATMVRQMSSKWGDAAIQVITFDEAAEIEGIPGGLRFRSEFVHLMSLMHSLALQVLRGDHSLQNLRTASFMEVAPPPPVDAAQFEEWENIRGNKSVFFLRVSQRHYEKYWRACPFPVIGGVNPSEAAILDPSHQRVFLVMCWVHRLLVARRLAGGIKEDAPIVSRIYQVLSDGMMGFENALKLSTTPFPFPFAQSVALLLHVNAIAVPLVMARWAGPTWLVALMSFLTVFCCYLLNEVAREIEEPFKFDPNDLPVVHYQYKFNEQLVTAFVKSLFPHQAGSLFNHIGEEGSLEEQVNRARPTLEKLNLAGKGTSPLDNTARHSFSGPINFSPEPFLKKHESYTSVTP